MKTTRKAALSFLLLLVMSLCTVVPAFAHDILIREREGDSVQFIFDDFDPFADAFVNVLDADGAVIAQGSTDGNGVFDYSAWPNAVAIEAQDLAGHRAVYNIPDRAPTPEPEPSPNGIDRNAIIHAVVGLVCVAVAIIASKVTKKKEG